MVGRALLTIVLDSMATNIARRRPLSASSTSRWVICPLCSAGTVGAWVTEFLRSWLLCAIVVLHNYMPDGGRPQPRAYETWATSRAGSVIRTRPDRFGFA